MSSSTPSGKSNRVGQRRASALARMERTHPLLVILYFGLVGIAVLFIVLVAAYVQSRYLHPVPAKPFPRFFALSTVLLVLSSGTLRRTNRHYRKDNLRRLARSLGYTLLLGLSFVAAQALGWRELWLSGVFVRGPHAGPGAYIYLLSALHAVHLLVGMGFLAYFWARTRHAAADGVRMLVFIRNPYRRLQLRMLRLYWHFMDGLWFTLFLVLLLTL